jgi:hypothetical protein
MCDRMATRHLEFHRDSECAATRNMPVQVFYGNTAITSLTMSVDCVQKLAPAFAVTFSKSNTTGVANSGATLPA